jgi:5-methylcytosine-specific restriction endonuclease McrA
MPTIPRKAKERAYIYNKKSFSRKKDNSKFYNGRTWRKKRIGYINRHPFCEVCGWFNRVSEAKFLDHIIRLESGGAEYDDKNLMGMCERDHNIKSGKEAHNPILIKYQSNDRGDFIPVDRNELKKIYQ